jgi:aminoglycoside phosphotransferase (APT) family kinase protein
VKEAVIHENIRRTLQDYFTKKFPEKREVTIKNITALNEGWESIIYAFDVHSGHPEDRQREVMILRIYPGEDAYYKSIREFEGMLHLYKSGYPVPKVYALERDESPLGKPFMLMERIDGEMMWPVLDHSTPEDAAVLITKMCALFVHLHSLDWRDFVTEEERSTFEEPYAFIDRYLEWLRAMTKSFPDLNIFMPIFGWLEARRDKVPCNHPAPVHWDYHPGNLILQPGGALIVIDWTQIQVTDPRFDLGWTLLLAGAYSGEDIRNYILGEYQRLSGAQIEQLDYFDVANAVKRLGSVMISLSSGAEQMGMRPDAVASMRREFPQLRWVYNLMVKRTGIHLPEVEQFLEI